MEKFITRLEKNFKEFPERIAVRSALKPKGISYSELNIYSAKIYSYLKKSGIGKEDMVLICMPRGVRAIVSAVGVIKAGAAFTIVESTYAADRIAFINKDCNCKIVIDEEKYSEMMDCEPIFGHEETDPHDACFAVYTSGSTGNPKGVLHEYGKLEMAVEMVLNSSLPTPEGSVFAGIAPLNFVASVMIILYALYTGMCLYILPYDIVKNPALLTKFLEEEKVAATFLPPSLLKIYANPSRYLKNVYVGGEPCNGVFNNKLNIINCYAASESGMVMASFVLDKMYDKTPVGTNKTGQKMYIAGEDGKELPQGETGEICFEDTYTRGYINLPEKNKEAFIDGIYHTGDLGYVDEDGNFVISGRKDDMIKINGNRIEPAEIEGSIKRVLNVRNVIAKGFSEGDRAYICAYLIKGELESLNLLDEKERLKYSTEEMKEKLSEKLPYYMIPTYYVIMDAFPLNANGKIAKKELKAPKAETYAEEYAEPENEEEEYFCKLFSRILKIDKVGVNDDFYLIGGDSISSINLIGECRYKAITVGDLYKCRTPRKLAGYCSEKFGEGEDIEDRNRKALKHPQTLSLKMHQMFEYELMLQKSTVWNLTNLLKMHSGTNPYKLAEAVDKVLLGHPVFRTVCFYNEFGELRQKFLPDNYKNVQVTKLTSDELEKKKSTLIKPFDLMNNLLYRAEIFATEDDVYLYLDIHHAITDGTSISIILEQIVQCYNDPDVKLPEDYYYLNSREREKYLSGSMRDEVQNYYACLEKDTAENTCSYCVNIDHNASSFSGGWYDYNISVDKNFNGNEYIQSIGGNVFFMTVFLLTQAKYNKTENSYLQWIFNGRDTAFKTNSAGLYIRTLPLFGRMNGEKTIGELFNDVKLQIEYSSANCEVQYQNPYIDKVSNESIFIYQKDMYNLSRIKGIESFEVLSDETNNADSLFEFSLLDEAERDDFACEVEYSADHYERETIECFVKTFNDIAKQMCSENDIENCRVKDVQTTKMAKAHDKEDL